MSGHLSHPAAYLDLAGPGRRSCLALHRAGFAWPPRHRDAGALLPHLFTFACTRLTCCLRHRPCVSVALSRGFPRVGVTHRPRPLVSGLSSRGFLSPRGRSARASDSSAEPQSQAGAVVRRPRCNRIEYPEPDAGSRRDGSGKRPRAGDRGRARRPRLRRPGDRHRPRGRRAAPPRRSARARPRSGLDVRDAEACRAAAAAAVSPRRLARPLGQQRRRPRHRHAPGSRTRRRARTMVDVNAIGTMNGTVAALERMTEAGSGHVINVVSLAGHRRRARRGRLLGEQARGAGLHPRHPLRPAPRRHPGHRAERRLPRRDLDADARGQARRPRRGRLLLRAPAHPRAGRDRRRQADRPARGRCWSCPAGAARCCASSTPSRGSRSSCCRWS